MEKHLILDLKNTKSTIYKSLSVRLGKTKIKKRENAVNFTYEIKKEIIKNGFENTCCKTASLSAFLRTTGSIITRGSFVGFEIITENEIVAEYFVEEIENTYGEQLKIAEIGTDNRNGKDRLVLDCIGSRSFFILSELGIAEFDGEGINLKMEIDQYLIENSCCCISYIKGAFLGSGSCVLPKDDEHSSGYHLEIIFSSKGMADGFCELLAQFDILAKCVQRKNSYVVYLKSKDSISDFLSLCGAMQSLEKLDELAERREVRNNINRVANCRQKNFDKSVLASVKQIQAIEIIESAIGINSLDESLKKVAEVRLADKEASLKELSEMLNISKSCLNHRLRKLIKIAEEL